MLPVLLAQQLTITSAIERADAHAFANRIADAQTREQSAAQVKALGGILPTVRVEAGYVRTTDPVATFGTSLRQRRITQLDFDPARLNYPGPTSNYVGALVVEQPLLNLDAHLGRVAAVRVSDAADATRAWSRAAVRLAVIKAYYGAVLAREKVTTLEAAVAAAQSHVAQAEKMVKQGLATRSDALLARVKAGDLEAELLSARGDATLAIRQLALLIGSPADRDIDVPTALPSYEVVAQLLGQKAPSDAVDGRNDLIAAERMAASAKIDVQRARAMSVPRLNAFARYDWNAQTSAFAGDENWTVGVMASWTPFAGGGDVGERSAASARRDAAQAGLEAVRAQASLEAQSAEINREVALARLEIARGGAEQGVEAHRIVARKYEGGLATITELLDAAATQTHTGLTFAHARFSGLVSAAELLRATGREPADIVNTLNGTIAGVAQ